MYNNGNFTFIVGEEHTEFNVHVSVLAKISAPLEYLMKNGKMEESSTKRAIIRDVEAPIFGLLINYAYKGLPGVIMNVHDPDLGEPPHSFQCLRCGKLGTDSSLYPFCGSSCCKSNGQRSSTNHCVVPSCSVPAMLGGAPAHLLCQTHDKTKHHRKYTTVKRPGCELVASQSVARYRAGNPYRAGTYLPSALTQMINANATRTIYRPDIKVHAKLCVLADRYMVSELKGFCLHMLFHNLKDVNVDDSTIEHVVDLLRYIYDNTEPAGDITTHKANDLRRLIMAFAVAHAKDVMKYPIFKQLQVDGGDLAADFTALLVTWSLSSIPSASLYSQMLLTTTLME